MRRTISFYICLMAVLAGCTSKNAHRPSPLVLPTSGGRSYEVLVTGGNWAAVEATANKLRSITMDGLPREEEAFDVSTLVAPELNQGTRYVRNIIFVSTDSTQLQQVRVSYEQDIYAYPQMLIRLDAASTEQLKQWLEKNIQTLVDQLTKAEMNNGIRHLREHHNQTAEQTIAQTFGCRLWIPEDLNKMKQGQDFLWFSNDGISGMQNVCIYRYPADSLGPELMLNKRDSVMQHNIEGELPTMHMATTLRSVHFHMQKDSETNVLGARGLWEMKGDNMGGPFVSMARLQGDSVLCIEGFVYAPGMNKRNLMRRLEASLYTLKLNR